MEHLQAHLSYPTVELVTDDDDNEWCFKYTSVRSQQGWVGRCKCSSQWKEDHQGYLNYHTGRVNTHVCWMLDPRQLLTGKVIAFILKKTLLHCPPSDGFGALDNHLFSRRPSVVVIWTFLKTIFVVWIARTCDLVIWWAVQQKVWIFQSLVYELRAFCNVY